MILQIGKMSIVAIDGDDDHGEVSQMPGEAIGFTRFLALGLNQPNTAHQTCRAPGNERGSCRHLHHCLQVLHHLLPSLPHSPSSPSHHNHRKSSLPQFLIRMFQIFFLRLIFSFAACLRQHLQLLHSPLHHTRPVGSQNKYSSFPLISLSLPSLLYNKIDITIN